MMNKEQDSFGLEEHPLKKMKEKAVFDLRLLSFFEEEKDRTAKTFKDPLSKAIANFKFIEDSVSPVLINLCNFGKSLDSGYKTGLRVEFGPSRDDQKIPAGIVVYDGAEVHICSPQEGWENDLTRSKGMIQEKYLRTLYNRREEEAEAIHSFGRISKKEIVSKIIDAIELISLPNPVEILTVESPPATPHVSHLSAVKAFFTGHKN